ncbi:hypothetical protein [Leisingera sp. NJS204]|uniref:hypothetical protein n=1 Tax=Leisingera sp. NJS204 TaxID=2508307 RepID=UPI00101013CD|nr:hypothetical protein [Leisingera sp. NJS204]QAX29159.1 hypothetical protein ETW24_07210 [Leisingera sp. NJS204]
MEHNLLAAGLGLAASPATAGLDYPAVSERCFNFEGGGPYHYGREEETGKDYCYVIDYVNHLELIPMYLPRGNVLKYSKLDRSRRGGREGRCPLGLAASPPGYFRPERSSSPERYGWRHTGGPKLVAR